MQQERERQKEEEVLALKRSMEGGMVSLATFFGLQNYYHVFMNMHVMVLKCRHKQ